MLIPIANLFLLLDLFFAALTFLRMKAEEAYGKYKMVDQESLVSSLFLLLDFLFAPLTLLFTSTLATSVTQQSQTGAEKNGREGKRKVQA